MQEAHDMVRQMEEKAGITPGEVIVVHRTQEINTATISDIWALQFIKRTIMLWILWFGIVYSYYGIFTWLPSLMVGQGYAVIKTFEYVLVMTLAQLPGYFAAAYLVDRIGRKGTLAGFLAASANLRLLLRSRWQRRNGLAMGQLNVLL